MPFERIFSEASLLPEIRRSIYLMTLGNIFGTVFGVICASSTSSMTGYAEYLGAGDFIYGVLTAIPLAAAFFQIPFSALVSRTQKRKRYMMTYGVISRAMWILVGLVPYFIPADKSLLRIWSVIFLIGVSSALSSFINVCWMPWMADLVPIGIRGRWLSKKDGITSVASVTMGLIVAGILDRMPGITGYTIVFVMGGILGVLDMCCFGLMKEVYRTPPVTVKLLPVFRQIISNKPFFRFVIFWTAWSFTSNMSGAYLSRYALTEMKLTYMQYTLCSQVASAAVTVTVVHLWGKLLDRFGSKTVMWLSCVVGSMTHLFYLFSTPGNIWPTLLHNVVGATFWSGSNLAATSLQLSASPDAERPTYIAFFSCVTSLFGSFLGILTGGAILEGVQSSAVLSSMISDRYQFMFVIAVSLRLLSVFILVPQLDNDSEHNISDMFRSFSAAMKQRVRK